MSSLASVHTLQVIGLHGQLASPLNRFVYDTLGLMQTFRNNVVVKGHCGKNRLPGCHPPQKNLGACRRGGKQRTPVPWLVAIASTSALAPMAYSSIALPLVGALRLELELTGRIELAQSV